MAKSFLLRPPSILVGLDADRVDRLRAAGITNLALLFERGPRAVHRVLPGTTADQIGGWFCAAMLLRVTGVTPDLAATLVAGGVRSVARLAGSDLQALEQLVAAARDAGTLAEVPTLYALSALQQRAARVLSTGMLAGRVLTRTAEASSPAPPTPIADATCTIAGESAESDDEGWFALNRVPEGRARLTIELPDRLDRFAGRPLDIIAGKFARLVLVRVPAVARPLVSRTRYESDGVLVGNRAGLVHRLVDRPIAEFPGDSYFLVRDISAAGGEARLLCFDKAQSGRTVLIERTRVTAGSLPASTAVGDVLQWRDGALARTSLTPADVRRQKLERWRAARPVHRRRRIDIG
jgi:hypothetical protein